MSKVYMLPNPPTPNYGVEIDPNTCNGCNMCVHVCRTDVFMPNKVKGGPPIVLYPDECWFEADCVAHCPVEGAIRMLHPINQRASWKRKATGEIFRLGMLNPPPPNTRPPVR